MSDSDRRWDLFMGYGRYAPETEVRKIRDAIKRWGIGKPGSFYLGIRFSCMGSEVAAIKRLLTEEEKAVVYFA